MLRERGLKTSGKQNDLVASLAEHTPDNGKNMMSPVAGGGGGRNAFRRTQRRASDSSRREPRQDQKKCREHQDRDRETVRRAQGAQEDRDAKKKQNQTEGVDEVALNTTIRMGCLHSHG